MIRPRAAAIVLVAVLSGALLGAGCGGDDDAANEFRERYNAAIDRLGDVNTGIQESGREIGSQPGSAIAREFNRIADVAAQTRDDLQGLDPPEDARDEFEELLGAIEGGVTNIRAVAKAAKSENQQRFLEATGALARSGEQISDAERRLKAAVDSEN